MKLSRRYRRTTRSTLSELLDGDLLFCFADGGDGGGGDGAPGGDGGGDGGDGGGSGGDGAPGGDGDGDGGAPGGDGGTQQVSQEEARKLRSENRNLRKREKEALDRIKALEDRDATELEKSQRTAAESEARATKAEEENRKLRVQVAATTVGIHPKRVAAAQALVDWEDVDVDDASAVAAALKALKDEHEYLFTSDAGDIDAGARDRRDRKDDDIVVTPGEGRLSKAYADSSQ